MTREGNYLLQPSATGTTIIRSTDQTSGLTAPPAPLARWFARWIVAQKLLPQLKAALEG